MAATKRELSALGNAPLRLAGVFIGRRLAQRSAAGLRGAEKGLVHHALAVVLAQFAALAEEDPPGQAVAGLGDIELLADHAPVLKWPRQRADVS
nr:hypothetical protein [Streptomyces sp. NEAU-HV9]